MAIGLDKARRWLAGVIAPHAAPRRGGVGWPLNLAAYDAAEVNRLADTIAQGALTAAEAEQNRAVLVNQARHATRTTAPGASAKAAYQRTCVGGAGITSKATARNPYTGEPLKAFNDRVDADFEIWAGEGRWCDLLGRSCLKDMQYSGIGDWFEAGELLCLWDYAYDPRSPVLGLRLRMLEPEMLDSAGYARSSSGNEIVDGVEIAPDGTVVGFHLRVNVGWPTQFVPASRIWHAFMPARPGSRRGIPRLAPVLPTLQYFVRYVQYTVLAAQAQACQSLTFKMGEESDPDELGLRGTNGTSIDANGNPIFNMEPVSVHYLKNDESLDLLSPNQPQSVFGPFCDSISALLASASGLDLQTLTRNYNGANYSSLRKGALDFRAESAGVLRMAEDQWLRGVRRRWTELSILEGRYDDLVGSEYWTDLRWREAYLAAMWNGPPEEWDDPEKDANALKLLRDEGFITLQEIANRRGTSAEELIRRRAEEDRMELDARAESLRHAAELAKDLKLPISALMPEIQGSGVGVQGSVESSSDSGGGNGRLEGRMAGVGT